MSRMKTDLIRHLFFFLAPARSSVSRLSILSMILRCSFASIFYHTASVTWNVFCVLDGRPASSKTSHWSCSAVVCYSHQRPRVLSKFGRAAFGSTDHIGVLVPAYGTWVITLLALILPLMVFGWHRCSWDS